MRSHAPGDLLEPTPVLFSRLWEGLVLHTTREVDDRVVFKGNCLPTFWGVFISEYSLTYSFVMVLRMLRRISPLGEIEVSCGEEPTSLNLNVMMRGDGEKPLREVLSPYIPFLKNLLSEIDIPTKIALGEDGFALCYSLPMHRGTEMILRDEEWDYVYQAVMDAMAASF